MSKMRLLVAVLSAAIAVMVVVSATASAEWMVNKKNFGAGSKMALMTKAKNNGGVLIAAGVEIKCQPGENIEGVAAEISGTNAGKAQSVVFNECAVSNGATCSIPPKIGTVPLLITELTLEGTLAIKGFLKPHTKTIFATIEFKGPECALLGTQPVQGKVSLLAPKGQDELTWQPVLLRGEGLKVGLNEASLHIDGELAVSTLEPWSFL